MGIVAKVYCLKLAQPEGLTLTPQKFTISKDGKSTIRIICDAQLRRKAPGPRKKAWRPTGLWIVKDLVLSRL
jgi:hypothetical protein